MLPVLFGGPRHKAESRATPEVAGEGVPACSPRGRGRGGEGRGGKEREGRKGGVRSRVLRVRVCLC